MGKATLQCTSFFFYALTACILVILTSTQVWALTQVGVYDVFEVSFKASGNYLNPYVDTSVTVNFVTPSGKDISINGFWDGGNVWKVRLAPNEIGIWTFSTSSSDSGLNDNTGSFECIPSGNRGHVRINDSRPFSFEYVDGSPFFWLADTNWDWANKSTPFDGAFQNYVDTRASQGFSVIQGTLEPTGAGGRGYPRYSGENEGGPMFSNFDVGAERLNPLFFKWMDKRVKYIMGKGLALAFWFVWADDWGSGVKGARFERYVRYLVSRYGAYNVVWGVMGEYEEIGDSSAVRKAGQFIKSIDPYRHPLTTHTVNTTTDDFGSDDWIDFHAQQSWTTSVKSYNSAATRDRAYGKPVVQLEIGYEDELGGEIYRKGGWAFLTGGGFFTYGERRIAWDKPASWSRDLNTPGAKEMTHVRTFWDAIEWWEMEPKNSLVSTGFCLAQPGREYVIYLPSGGGVNVDLSAASGSLDVAWFNPRNGLTSKSGKVAAGGLCSFTAPDNNDWVLHLRGAPADATPPATPAGLVILQ